MPRVCRETPRPRRAQRDGTVTEAKKRSRGNKRSALRLLSTTHMTDRPRDCTCHVARHNDTCGIKWRNSSVSLAALVCTPTHCGLRAHNGGTQPIGDPAVLLRTSRASPGFRGALGRGSARCGLPFTAPTGEKGSEPNVGIQRWLPTVPPCPRHPVVHCAVHLCREAALRQSN